MTMSKGRPAVAAIAMLSLVFPWVESHASEDGTRITQEKIVSGELSFREIREEGLRMFATRFTRSDGFGDGPMNPADTITPGGRPTLGGNGMLLRINGLDAQSCIECHSVIRADTVPPTFGVGGVGGSVTNAVIMPTFIDPADLEGNGQAALDGRFANPPFLFGAGAVELLGLEMTEDLHEQRRRAVEQPGFEIELVSKGVHFGSIIADATGELDLSRIVGVDTDLVVEPFGRKGEFATMREFDIGAFAFHFGMQPVEDVGHGIDDDGDGVVDEVLAGELSALSAFFATLERPVTQPLGATARRGFATFGEIGCADCHRPTLNTRGKRLPLRFPEVREDPRANAWTAVDLTRPPVRFRRNRVGGIRVPLFADLKRHDMGPNLAETFGPASEQTNREFTTARLWGVADTAPYLHDGRATTLDEAIRWHGGEAEAARDAFVALSENRQEELLRFLRSLRTPSNPAAGLLSDTKDDDEFATVSRD